MATIALAAALVVGCASGTANTSGSPTAGSANWSAEALGREAQKANVTPILVNSAPGVGVNRLSFVLLDKTGQPVSNATETRVRLFTLDGDTGSVAGGSALRRAALNLEGVPHQHSDGANHLHEGPEIAMYTAVVELTRPDFWGAEISWSVDGKAQQQRLRFFVRPSTPEPGVGAVPPASVQKTLRDGIALTDLDTSQVPQEALHQQTIAEAVTSGRVSVIAFATPAFCQTRFCGPVLESVVVPVWQRYRDRINAIHVEPFDVVAARKGSLVPEAVTAEWGLQSEPWVFVIGKDGRVAAKFEGILSVDELTEAIDRALAG
ncbi:MAG: hypothetical protein U0360_09025 [Dehalococcoidia bacterium]